MCNIFEVERKIENFALVYRMKKKVTQEDGTISTYTPSSFENTLFTTVLVIVTYLYIPIIRDSISTAFFIIDQ